MEVIHKLCAGLDVHKDSVVACVRLAQAGTVVREVRSFGTTTRALLELSAWLAEQAVTHIAMEATGVYWKPVWHILSDGEFHLLLANAAHIKAVPGRKTDVNDATWIADLLAHGLIRASFVPEPQIQDLRVLMRTRKQFVREQASHVQRIQKTLEDANIKLESLLSNVLGASGRKMIEALIAGEGDPDKLASFADRRVKASHGSLCDALHGRVTSQHRFLLALHLRQVDSIAALLGDIDKQVENLLPPFRAAVDLVMGMPGFAEHSARAILGEIGVDMSRFPTEGHLLSWACMCPRNDESAGKRRSSRLKKGANWLKATLIQSAWAASRKKGSYFNALFHRLKGRLGPKKAICAVAAAMLTTIYHMLNNGTPYCDLGGDHFTKRDRQSRANRLLKQLASLGFKVQIEPVPQLA